MREEWEEMSGEGRQYSQERARERVGEEQERESGRARETASAKSTISSPSIGRTEERTHKIEVVCPLCVPPQQYSRSNIVSV